MNRREAFVLPGYKIGVIEEYVPMAGTYVEEGTIFSAKAGLAVMDLMEKTVSVKSEEDKPKIPRVGSLVIGEVTNIQDRSLSIKIFKVEGRPVSSAFTGLLHISNVSQNYVKDMFDAFNYSDIIRAHVISTTNARFHLSTEGKDLGVIYSFCTTCGKPMIIRSGRLYCQQCKLTEKRKLASDYDLVEI
jgi:exosome complex component CSL4